ncbi:3-hydroxyisobutyrate dehydrogenase [Culex quinquefasciatus]|uniref:3-hydroxyisobutyrate dehydrogenase n=1 Tax=Culex quinquefasciatus TaxID=7176 RepID=B0XDS4_CULQU|nr:3-hydroxyisobutyrate dehydrogenase [Culex quinquefasciatus]|eukprot:XP_001867796.1 3-hydroxyisobutyrate dehydrogenase [Culex quinquefasciatus]
MVASTLKARVIDKAKVAIAAFKDIASTPSPKRKRKINGSGDVSTLYLDIFSPVRRKITPAEPPRNGGASRRVLPHPKSTCRACRTQSRNFQDPNLKFGFLDIMVCCIFKNLLNSGHFQEAAAKGYVEMTGVDPETSQDIAEEIIFKGGRFSGPSGAASSIEPDFVATSYQERSTLLQYISTGSVIL